MDSFMDKLAEKLNAGEIIKANRAADVEEKEKLQGKLKEYQDCLDQMCRINQEMKAAIEQIAEEAIRKIGETSADCARMEEELNNLKKTVEKIQKTTEEASAKTNEHVHKENVKVYRNVQAVMIEESAKHAEGLAGITALLEEMKAADAVKKTPGIWKAILGVSVVSMLLAAASVLFQVLLYLQII